MIQKVSKFSIFAVFYNVWRNKTVWLNYKWLKKNKFKKYLNSHELLTQFKHDNYVHNDF